MVIKQKKHYEEIHRNTFSVTSRYDRGGGSPLSTLVDTSIIKLWKQADTKNIGKGLFLFAENNKAKLLRRNNASIFRHASCTE